MGQTVSARGLPETEDNPILRALRLPPGRPKPRTLSMNLCLDDGVGLLQTADALDVVGAWVDVIRVGRAGAAIFSAEWLRKKAELCRARGIELEIGGPLDEVAFLQGRVPEYMAAVAEMGVAALEISENLIELSPADLARDIAIGQRAGVKVYFEYGRKYPDEDAFNVDEAVVACEHALEAGAALVQIERSEIDVALERDPERLVALGERVGLDKLTWEAGPRKPELAHQLLELLGPDVNLASLTMDPTSALDGVFLVENARRGMERCVGYSFIAGGARLEDPPDSAP